MSFSTLSPIPMSEDVKAACDDCDWTGLADDCQPIKDPSQRLNAGSEVPAGECPECGCLAYVKGPETNRYYEVQTNTTINGWVNVWQTDGEPLNFLSEKGARDALVEFFEDLTIAEMFDKYSRDDYRIVRFETEVLT